MPMMNFTQERFMQPREETILFIKQMARMYRTERQSDNTQVVVGLN